MTTAQQLKNLGCRMFRAGIWKPRTKPGGFEGNGEVALPWMKQVKEETGMLTATEVATPEHVELALKYGIDILWVGARTSANPFAMQALADSLKGIDVPVFVKNPVNPDLELWIGAMERINQAGIKRMAAIHRGFSSFDKKIYRNLPMWQIPIELRRRIPELPIICDPSHIGGRRELVAPLCQQAMDLGFDGLMVESHCSPDNAWSDAKQQVTPDVLDYILSLLVVRSETVTTEGIHELRKQIDEMLRPHVTSGTARRATTLLETLRLEAYTQELPIQEDRIHVANGTLFLNGEFRAEKNSAATGCRSTMTPARRSRRPGCGFCPTCWKRRTF